MQEMQVQFPGWEDPLEKGWQPTPVSLPKESHGQRRLAATVRSVCVLNHVRLFATPWTVACRALLSIEFSRHEYWNCLLFPTPGNLPNPKIKPTSPVFLALAGGFFTTVPPGKPALSITCCLTLGSSTETRCCHPTDIHEWVLDEEVHGTIKR